MIIECPLCGTKNQTIESLQHGKVYRCGNCKEVITFLETDDSQSTTLGSPPIERTDDIVIGRTHSQEHSAKKPKVSTAAFASGSSRARLVSFFFALILVVEIIAVVFDFIEIQLINRVARGEVVTLAEATASDDRQAAIAVIYILLFIITAILFLMWIHRAHRNLSSLGSTNLKYSPGWAVGWFFIPLFNIWKPYQVTTEIWKASDPTTDINDSTAWQSSPASSIVSSWWFLFLVTGFLGYIASRMSINWETISEVQAASWVNLIFDVAIIPAIILAILVVQNINLRQEKKRQLILSSTSLT